MQFKTWLESRYYHGTQSGDMIRERGFEVSTSGGGQRGLLGVWLTKDPTYAKIYANALHDKSRRSEVIEVEVPDDLNIIDLGAIENEFGNGNDGTKARWKFAGYDIDQPETLEPVHKMQPFAMTKMLQGMGYDGAWIPNTIQKGGSPELVIFDPKNVRLI